MLQRFISVFFLFCSLSGFNVQAIDIPQNLQQWTGWTQYQQGFRQCPSLNGALSGDKNSHLCAWPGVLTLDVEETQAQFLQDWTLLDESRLPLPGSVSLWPQHVRVNGNPVAVMEENSAPYVLLPKGAYRVTGDFVWKKRPESLIIPSQVALLDVRVNQKPLPFVTRDRNLLWLGYVSQNQVQEKDFLKVRVNRLIKDGHPMLMTVAIDLDVSGRAREQKLTHFSLDNYQLMNVDGDLNSRLDNQGDLWMQLKPGNHRVNLVFKIHDFPESLAFVESGDDWPLQEIWIYQNNERLRSTQIEGVAAIDSDQGFVTEWKALPHFVLNRNDQFTIKERSRGMTHGSDALSLHREMWLSFDDEKYYFFDQIMGSKSENWRVNTQLNYALTQLSNHHEPRLITYDNQHRTGAEIRTPNIDIEASGEVSRENMQQATGWDIPFANSSISLNIPPGRKVFNIHGADYSSGDWVSQWTLIDLFFVLVTIALVFRFFGWISSLFAFFTLLLGYHEASMPIFLWFNLVVAFVLSWTVQTGKISKILNLYKWVSVALLLVTLLPFLANQIRYTLYPQLERNQSLNYPSYPLGSPDLVLADAVQSPSEEYKTKSYSQHLKPQAEKRIVITGSRVKRVDVDTSYEAGAVIQAGKGKPKWMWQQVSYGWNGPVSGDESVRVTLLSSLMVKVLRIALIVFSLLWLISLCQKVLGGGKISSFLEQKLPPTDSSDPDKKSSVSLKSSHLFSMLIVVALLAGGMLQQPLNATEYPNQVLLQELQNRLYPSPDCEPDCVSLSQASLKVNGLDLTLSLDYQSAADKAGLLPQSQDWHISSILLNQKTVHAVWQNPQGQWLQLPKGLSKVVIQARLKDKSELTVQFLEHPKLFQQSIQGWEVSGLNQNHLVGDSLQLTRVAKFSHSAANSDMAQANEKPIAKEQSILELFSVKRSLSFGTQWRLETRVSRLAPRIGSVTAKIPLLDFEQPLEMTENIKEGQMMVVIAADSQSVSWHSSIQGKAEFELHALQNKSLIESWDMVVYPNWNIQLSGVPLVRPETVDADDIWVYQYYPRKGESLQLRLTKPSAVQGASLAITEIQQKYSLSKRKTTQDLVIHYKATRAESLVLNLGEAQLKSLRQDSQLINLAQDGNSITLNLKPGEHQLNLSLETVDEISVKQQLPTVQIAQDFSNLSTELNLPQSRWLLAANGPGYGPAIIYWGELIFFFMLAMGLSRLSFSPLRYWQWLILGMGMSTFSWPAMALVAAWLLGSQWRRQQEPQRFQNSILTNWLILGSTISAVFALVFAVPHGLLQTPDMGVIGNGSYGHHLIWFLDRGNDSLGETTLFSLPIWVYKGLMLLWATWLSFSLIKWLGWIWKDFSGAVFFRPRPKKNTRLTKKEVDKEKTSDESPTQTKE